MTGQKTKNKKKTYDDVWNVHCTPRRRGIVVGQNLVVDEFQGKNVGQVYDGRFALGRIATARDVGTNAVDGFDGPSGFGVVVGRTTETSWAGHDLSREKLLGSIRHVLNGREYTRSRWFGLVFVGRDHLAFWK